VTNEGRAVESIARALERAVVYQVDTAVRGVLSPTMLVGNIAMITLELVRE
jgi:hypothetical protein